MWFSAQGSYSKPLDPQNPASECILVLIQRMMTKHLKEEFIAVEKCDNFKIYVLTLWGLWT